MNGAVHPLRRYIALDSVRGLCACMVVLMHLNIQGYMSQTGLIRNAFLFVDFFFVLSGFVIGSSYGERLIAGFPVARFMALRLGRIYPLHITVLLLFVLFEFSIAVVPGLIQRNAFAEPFSLEALVQSALLIQIFSGPEFSGWNLPSWSIAAEIWTYLIFAGLLRWASHLTIGFCIVVSIVSPIFLAMQSDRYMNVVHDGALVRCMFGFALGMIGWRAAKWVASIALPQWVDHAAELVVTAVIILFVSMAGAGPFSLGAPFLFVIAVLMFSRERGIVSSWLARGPFVLVGALSYSIYMIHTFLQFRITNIAELAMKFGAKQFGGAVDAPNVIAENPLWGDALSMFFLALVILCAYASYRLIERPAQGISRKWVDNGRASH